MSTYDLSDVFEYGSEKPPSGCVFNISDDVLDAALAREGMVRRKSCLECYERDIAAITRIKEDNEKN